MMRMKAEQWSKVIDVNLNGVFHITRAVLKTMMKQEGEKSSRFRVDFQAIPVR